MLTMLWGLSVVAPSLCSAVKLADHRLESTRASGQVVETTLDIRRGLVQIERRAAERAEVLKQEEASRRMKELEASRKGLTGEEAKQATEAGAIGRSDPPPL